MPRSLLLACLSCFLYSHDANAQPAALRVVAAGPTGEVATIQEANEVRVVFSEPMLAMGAVPPRVKPSFITITPAVAGT